jgi:hypothetical protein
MNTKAKDVQHTRLNPKKKEEKKNQGARKAQQKLVPTSRPKAHRNRRYK